MNHVKFRGKHNGKWVYGFLRIGSDDRHFISYELEKTWHELEVVNESVGQYIGFEDVFKKEIFSNDICLREDGQKCVIKFYANSWCMDMSDFYPKCKEGWCETIKGTPALEIIGNTYDYENFKELLK